MIILKASQRTAAETDKGIFLVQIVVDLSSQAWSFWLSLRCIIAILRAYCGNWKFKSAGWLGIASIIPSRTLAT